MKRFFDHIGSLLLVLVAVMVMVGLAYAGETLKDDKGYYELNNYGSKCRLSQKDYDLKKQGLPYGLTLVAEDMSDTEKQAKATEAAQAAADAKTNEIATLKQQIIDLSIQKDKAQTLGFADVVSSLTTQISEKQTRLATLQGG